MLQYCAREIIERIAAQSGQIAGLAAPVRAAGDTTRTTRALPRRRPAAARRLAAALGEEALASAVATLRALSAALDEVRLTRA